MNGPTTGTLRTHGDHPISGAGPVLAEGWAVLVVMILHFTILNPVDRGRTALPPWGPASGWVGWTCFFVLSGFLITGILI